MEMQTSVGTMCFWSEQASHEDCESSAAGNVESRRLADRMARKIGSGSVLDAVFSTSCRSMSLTCCTKHSAAVTMCLQVEALRV